ncbi:MAG: bifunctional nuclease family protein [Treponema sp.]|jgi:bifunctional DNase/RNase|nr:bifunctional nuclease family protein [Treponema sp.]
MLEAEIWSVARIDQGNAVLLRPLGSDIVVPIFIGELETHAILLGLGDVKVKRPLTCDTLLELGRRLGLKLLRVEVYEMKDDVFHARLFFSGGKYSDLRPLVLESRPSDALALAVREKCGVYVTSELLEQAGIPMEIFIEEVDNAGDRIATIGDSVCGATGYSDTIAGGTVTGDTDQGRGPSHKGPKTGNPLVAKRRKIQAELEQAVAGEAYERAAELRDILILLDQQLEQERRKAP